MSPRFTLLMSVPSFPSYRWIFLVSFHRESRQQASFVEEQCKLWKHRICGLTVKDLVPEPNPSSENPRIRRQFRNFVNGHCQYIEQHGASIVLRAICVALGVLWMFAFINIHFRTCLAILMALKMKLLYSVAQDNKIIYIFNEPSFFRYHFESAF